jgi:hypothetical protein
MAIVSYDVETAGWTRKRSATIEVMACDETVLGGGAQ